MKDFRSLVETISGMTGVRRSDVRIDPNSPLEGPYCVILAHYDEVLTKENENEAEIIRIEKDKHQIDDFETLENIYKNRAEDPFDSQGRSLNGREPLWELDDEKCRYHISNARLVKGAQDRGVRIEAMSPPLTFPKE